MAQQGPHLIAGEHLVLAIITAHCYRQPVGIRIVGTGQQRLMLLGLGDHQIHGALFFRVGELNRWEVTVRFFLGSDRINLSKTGILEHCLGHFCANTMHGGIGQAHPFGRRFVLQHIGMEHTAAIVLIEIILQPNEFTLLGGFTLLQPRQLFVGSLIYAGSNT